MLFVMHFGWYFGLYFGFFTSETISDGISGEFRIFGLEIKKKISGRVHGTPWNRFVLNLYMLLLTCQSQYLVLYSFSGCRAHSEAGPIGVSLDQGDFPLK